METRLSLLLMLLFAAGCPGTGGEPVGPEGSQDASECFENAQGDCVVEDPGCSSALITLAGDQACARCEVNGEDVDICGPLDVAYCVQRENPVGGTCQECVTDRGETVFNDCPLDANLAPDEVACETAIREDTSEACSICTDAAGNVVEVQCRPDAQDCADVVGSDGRLCEECYAADGSLAYRNCEASSELDPRICQVYENELGRCTDCFGAQNELLSHSCVLNTADAAVFCAETIGLDGLRCERCVNADGAVVSEACEEVGQDAEKCESLVFSEQTCVVCVIDGNVSFYDCVSDACGPNEGDLQPGMDGCMPPPCAFEFDSEGNVCRTCQTSWGEAETRCVQNGELFCEYIEEGTSISVPNDGEQPQAPCDNDLDCPQGTLCGADGLCVGGTDIAGTQLCLVCSDRNGEEHYRNCDGGTGNVANEPVCSVQELAFDERETYQCETCFASAEEVGVGEPIFDQCAFEACRSEPLAALHDANGSPVVVPGFGVEGEGVVVQCDACRERLQAQLNAPGELGEVTYASCAAWENCSHFIDGATQPGADPTVNSGEGYYCSEGVQMYYRSTQCANPWLSDDFTQLPGGSIDELQALMRWALLTVGAPVFQAVIEESGLAPEACAACGCADGHLIEVVVNANQRELFAQWGFLYEPPSPPPGDMPPP